MSEKIERHHLERKAIVYVRQSSAHQVMHNRESRGLQYAMRERLRQLGWSRIEVIDEDLGRSASGSAEREGFNRMVAEVCLGKVGAVAAREATRFTAVRTPMVRDRPWWVIMVRAYRCGAGRSHGSNGWCSNPEFMRAMWTGTARRRFAKW